MNSNINPRRNSTDTISFENKDVKDLILSKWDISFDINGEILANIMNFLTDIQTDIPLKFSKDGIFINLVSIDNVQYAEIEINAGDLLNYDAGFIIENINVSLGEEDNKDDNIIPQSILVVVDMKDTIGELEFSIEKDQLVTIRIDHTWNKKIEFHCSDGMIYWSRLVAPDKTILGLDKLHETIKMVRDKPDITKSVILMEPSAFNKLCKIGSKSSKKRDSDRITTIRVTKDGMFAASGDNIKGRILNLDYSNEFIVQNGADTISFNNFNNVNNEIQDDMQVIDMSDDTAYDMMNMDGQKQTINDNNVNNPVPTTHFNRLLGIDVIEKETVVISNDYMEPFSKLKGLSPITLEIRTNKPVVVVQKPYNGIKALLSVAPRVDKD